MFFGIRTDDIILIIHFTRNWFHYGTLGFVSMCTVIGAIRGVLS